MYHADMAPPPFQPTESAVTGHEGLPNAITRGDAYESMGGSDPPRTPMLERTTNTTAHSKSTANAVSYTHLTLPTILRV